MLSGALLATIQGLKEDYPSLYKQLSVMDEYLTDDEQQKEIHTALRARLLSEMNQVAVGMPKANAIHRSLRALTRLHPFNTQCPFTLEAIDLDNVDSYYAFSNGYIVSRYPELVNNLQTDVSHWMNPATREPYSQYDIEYIEQLYGIKQPLGFILTSRGVLTVLRGNFIATRNGEPELMSDDEIQSFRRRVQNGDIPVFKSMSEVLAYQQRRERLLDSIQRQRGIATFLADLEPLSTGPVDGGVDELMPADESTSRPQIFQRRPRSNQVTPLANPEIQSQQPRPQRRPGCCVIA